jgi:hypothetical protein
VDDGEWSRTALTVEERLGQTAEGWDELHLYQYQLPEVPPEVRGFRHLRSLYLYNNELASLPEWLGELPELTLLDVARNRLTEIPFSLLSRPRLEIRMHDNPLDPDRMFRTLIERYNDAHSEDVAMTCDPGITLHLPRVRPANGTGRDSVARMLNDAYPRYGLIEVIEADEHRAVLKPARAPQIELQLTWWSGRLRRVEGGRCPRPAA